MRRQVTLTVVEEHDVLLLGAAYAAHGHHGIEVAIAVEIRRDHLLRAAERRIGPKWPVRSLR